MKNLKKKVKKFSTYGPWSGEYDNVRSIGSLTQCLFVSVLMREPVLQDKRQEYLKFCKHATALIEKVSGKPQNTNFDISLERIRKVSPLS